MFSLPEALAPTAPSGMPLLEDDDATGITIPPLDTVLLELLPL
jgi:hypothetical protein